VALQVTEEAFWEFCDHYLELVKFRAYGDEDTPARRSAVAALRSALSVFLRLLAPFLPYVTEEVWSWRMAAGEGRERSIHAAPWPRPEELPAAADAEALTAAVEVLTAVRGTKSEAQKSLRWPVEGLSVLGDRSALDALAPVLPDVLLAGRVEEGGVSLEEGQAPEGRCYAVSVSLADSME
jgi:valyl-tRNA synthetase